jgi:uncharacterized coiled-coil DUF342 family protein
MQQHGERNAMNPGDDIDQFQLLEEKIDGLIELIRELRKENEGSTERLQIQKEKIADLSKQVEGLRATRDNAKQRIVSLLEKIEQINI